VRYAARIEDARLPRSEKARIELAKTVGADGFYLLERIGSEHPDLLKRESVEILQQVWLRHYARDEAGDVHWRLNQGLGPASDAIESPYDAEARHSRKRETLWTGYKVHFSETCDEQSPRLVTNVQTTRATEQDVSATADIHRSLWKKGCCRRGIWSMPDTSTLSFWSKAKETSPSICSDHRASIRAGRRARAAMRRNSLP
jgi:transposase